MELRHIEYFVAVAEELSFTRAAERLSIAQSPVSAQIRKLEKELGVKLFDRTTRSVVLTPAGQNFYLEAIALLASARRVADNARLAGQGRIGRLSLAFTGSATYSVMPQLITAYTQRYPGVVLEVRGEMLTPPQVEGLLNGSITVGVLRPPVNTEDLIVEVLREEPLVLLLPAGHPLATRVNFTLHDLRNEDFISYPSASPSTATILAACRQAGFTPRIRQEVAETSTLLALVASGLGVALAPASVRHLRLSGVTHRPVRDSDVRLPLAVAYRAGPVSPLVRGYLETARVVMRSRLSAAVGPTFEPTDTEYPDSV